MSKRIGVFDSGVGGLTVLKELVSSHPAEYVYIGDSLRAPYGNKSKEELLMHMKELLTFLQKKECDFYINACNSLSSLDVLSVLSELGISEEKYMDMISATRKSIGKDVGHDASVLIYATAATIRSNAYQDVFKDYDAKTLVSQNLAYAIETGDQITIDEEVDVLVDEVIANNTTHLFLGCTHFPLIGEYLEKRLDGLSIKIINPAEFVSKELHFDNDKKLTVEIYTTKNTTAWDIQMELFGVMAKEISLTEV